MLIIKFETKSARVKGLAFHPKRSWLLASLHNGVIQLWDYSERTMIDKFDEHKGPVRGLDFHQNQPLFVSGGDDSKLKVWNYKSRRCLFTLDAHEDYIRTAFFHHEEPWIISASDDQSIRIWNWINRTRISLLTGHAHYVMCAQFHPSNDFILSASIDQTLRLWDISGLRKKNTSSMSTKEEINAGLPEILSKTDYTVDSKDAHNSEINWCCFQPNSNKNLCLSVADDNLIKIWKVWFSGRTANLREDYTLRGHINSVNCAIFHPRKDLIISASEDKSIRVWDLDRRERACLHSQRRENDRFWTLAAHQNENLFAAGHDTGLMLFKLERERPVSSIVKSNIIFVKGNHLYRFNMDTNKSICLFKLKNKTEMTHYYHKLHCYSYAEDQPNQILLSTRSTNLNNSIYDIYKIPAHHRWNPNDEKEPNRGTGLTALFIGPSRYAILDKSKHVIFKVGDKDKEFKSPIHATEIFDAGTGRLFVRSKIDEVDSISLWDLEQLKAINSVKVNPKFVVMSQNKNFVACVCSNRIVICDGNLNILTTINEQRKIKSAVWDESGVLFYNTPVHIKYALTDGDTTTVRSVEQTLYLMAIKGNLLYYMKRNGDVKYMQVYPAEFKFKQAVIKNDKAGILASLRELKSPTRAEISFLVKKGHPGIALKFVKDPQTRFPLALQAYDIDVALDSASQINNPKCWEQLADVAMEVGHVRAAEKALIELKKPYKLAMLYLVCDQRDKMLLARSMAKQMGDTSTEFIISLLVKDFVECAQIMRRFHPNLAYTCAVNHGLYDLALEISQELSDEQLEKLPPLENANNSASWMRNTIPDIGNSPFDNWPLLNDDQENYEEILDNQPEEELEDLEDNDGWNDDDNDNDFEDIAEKKVDDQMEDLEDDEQDGWETEEQLEDLSDNDIMEDDVASLNKKEFVAPNSHQSITSKWVQSSNVALHHVLAGSYRTAYKLIQSQLGAVNVGPFIEVFKDIALQSRVAYLGFGIQPTMYIYPNSIDFSEDNIPLPTGGYRLDDLENKLLDCYGLFGKADFNGAIDSFRNLLLSTIFLQIYISDSGKTLEEREKRAKDIITTCREYIMGSQIWLERKNEVSKEDHKRNCELAAYFTRLDLSKHKTKVLEEALKVFLARPKELNYHKTRAASKIATNLLNRIGSDTKKAKMIAYAEKVKSSYDAQVDLDIKLDYDDLNPYDLCAGTFTPIWKGNKLGSCPLCRANYKLEYEDESLCKVCKVAYIGIKGDGIKYRIDLDTFAL